jgi:hypothetical protein
MTPRVTVVFPDPLWVPAMQSALMVVPPVAASEMRVHATNAVHFEASALLIVNGCSLLEEPFGNYSPL